MLAVRRELVDPVNHWNGEDLYLASFGTIVVRRRRIADDNHNGRRVL